MHILFNYIFFTICINLTRLPKIEYLKKQLLRTIRSPKLVRFFSNSTTQSTSHPQLPTTLYTTDKSIFQFYWPRDTLPLIDALGYREKVNYINSQNNRKRCKEMAIKQWAAMAWKELFLERALSNKYALATKIC